MTLSILHEQNKDPDRNINGVIMKYNGITPFISTCHLMENIV